MLRRDPEHEAGGDEVHPRRKQSDGYSPTEVFQRRRVEKAVPSGVDDGSGGKQYQRAFDPDGEILGLVVAIGMAIVRRLLGDRERRQGDQARGGIDQSLQRVRQQAHRTRQEIRAELQGQRRDRRGDRKQGHFPRSFHSQSSVSVRQSMIRTRSIPALGPTLPHYATWARRRWNGLPSRSVPRALPQSARL